MSSIQRRRGPVATIFRQVEVTDARGNAQFQVTPTDPHVVRVAVYPQRSARMEVQGGQMDVDVQRLIITADLADVGLWSRVEFQGEIWDVAVPPERHFGERMTHHWTLDIRRRPRGS